MHGEVALMFRLVVAVLTLEQLGRAPVFALQVALQIDLALEDLRALRTHLWRRKTTQTVSLYFTSIYSSSRNKT